MRPHAEHLSVTPEGLVDRPGISTPRGTMVVARQDDIIVIKVPGSHYYRGQGQQFGYAEGKYEVYKVLVVYDDGVLKVRGVTSFPVRQTGPFRGA